MPIGLADRIAGYVTEAFRSIPRRGAESGGLLLGGVVLGPVIDIFITGFEPIPCDYRSGPSFVVSDSVKAEFRSAMARHPAAEIVGYYRSHTRAGSGLDSSDQEIVDHIFPGLSGLVLLVKPSGITTLTAGYFFFQNGRLETRAVGPSFPFLVSVPGGTPPPVVPEPGVPAPVAPDPAVAEPSSAHPRATGFRELMQESLASGSESPDKGVAPRHVVAGPVLAELPETSQPPEPNKRRKKLQWEIVAAGLMIMAALGLLWWQYHGTGGEEDSSLSQAVPSHVASLGLAVQPGEGGWRITWDPNSQAARDAARGALHVTEDDSHERIPLSASQVRAGQTTYRPIGDDITFRLDLIGGDNALSTETYRVILRPREAEGAAPTQQTKTAPAPVKPAAKSEKPAEKAAEKAADKPEPKPEEGSYAESEVVNRVAPEVPDGIRPRITSPLPIDVRVSIDREGHVTKAAAIQHEDGLVDYLAKRAVAAARQWTFTPARRGGKPVESTRTIHFVFEQ
jgi:hypothetical protein